MRGSIDTRCFIEIIREINGTADYNNHTLNIDTRNIKYASISKHLLEQIHGTVYLLPAFLATFSACSFAKTGGCQIGEEDHINGKRPIDQILDVIAKFDSNLQLDSHCESDFQYTCDEIGKHITIDIKDYYGSRENIGPKPSGATKTAILLAMKSDDVVIKNPYLQSEVYDLISFLKMMGFFVEISKERIHIQKGNSTLQSDQVIELILISDVTEIMTYVTMAIVCNISVNIRGLRMEETIGFLQKDIATLRQLGVKLVLEHNRITIPWRQSIKSANLKFIPNEILSDHQPFYSLILTLSDNVSLVQDQVWPLRFQYAIELEKLGCTMVKERIGNLLIYPVTPYKTSQTLIASDLRAAAVLILAAMAIPGTTTIKNIDHLHRGYERLIDYVSEICECVIDEKK